MKNRSKVLHGNIRRRVRDIIRGVLSRDHVHMFVACTWARRASMLVLSQFSSGLFRAMFAMKETRNGNEIHRRVSA